MNRKTLLLALLALVLVLLGNWLTEQGVKEVDRRLAPPQAEAPQDYFMHRFTITALDEAGLPQHRLQADSLSHFSSEGATTLQQPRVELFSQGEIAWRISAEGGRLEQPAQELWLQGKVELRQSTGRTPLQLTTSALHLLPTTRVAETREAVTLTQGGNRIEAVGMKIEGDGERLTLLSQVRGRYAALVP